MRTQENLAKREDDMTAAVLQARGEHQSLIAGLVAEAEALLARIAAKKVNAA